MTSTVNGTPAGVTAFTFGDPEPVLDRGRWLEQYDCWQNGKWYEPPVARDGLAKAFDLTSHHSSAIRLKVNLLSRLFLPTPMLSRPDFRALALDYLVFGECYVERRDNRLGGPLALKNSLARYMRRGVKDGEFFFVQGFQNEHAFKPGSVLQVRNPDLVQEIYGRPEYLSALQSALLNENATLFRRKYYLNGSHAGVIFYLSDTIQDQQDIDAFRAALKDSKGPGNFKNLFFHSPNGKKDGIQVIPVGEIATKDEFMNIKAVTRDDVLAAHRVPPQLLGVVPNNAGGFGDIGKAAEVFHMHEIEPLQAVFEEISDWIGRPVVTFKPYVPAASGVGNANTAPPIV